MSCNLRWYTSRCDANDNFQNVGVKAPNVTIIIKFDQGLLQQHACGRELIEQLNNKLADKDDWQSNYLVEVIPNEILSAVDQYGQTTSKSIKDEKYTTVQDYYGTNIIYIGLHVEADQITFHLAEAKQNIEDWLPVMDADLLYCTPELPRFDAAELIVSSHYGNAEDEQFCPNKVYHSSNTAKLYKFKALAVAESMNMENKLNGIIPLQEDDYDLENRINRVEALVHYAGEPDRILGYLLRHIYSNGSLDDYVNDGRITPYLRDKWASQLRETLGALHQRGIVLGDIPIHEIVIDARDESAWVTYFDYAWEESTENADSRSFADDKSTIEWIIDEMTGAFS